MVGQGALQTALLALGGADAKKKLVLPAYDFVVKAAHAFNVLDARGAIGVTERARFIGRVRGMAKAFAAELGQHNIRVNSVHPTGVNTPMGSGNMQAEIGAAIAGYDRLGAMFINMLPVDATEPEDVADTVLFLACDESKFITAHEIAPDAGVTEF